MKYEDIQIGNYVKLYADYEWRLYKVNRKTFSKEDEIKNMVPIWITPELLKMLGFRVVEDNYAIYEKYYNIAGVTCKNIVSYNFQTSTLKITSIIENVDIDEFNGSVKTLHKLQQLMKLCGCKPLEVNEKELDNYLNGRR